MDSPPPVRDRSAPLLEIVAVFLKIGATAFGGSTAAWTYREIVEKRGWLSEDGYITGLTIANVLPGANPVNLALYVGLRLRGAVGATAAATGMLAPGFVLILTFGALYSRYGHTPTAHAVLSGLAAVGVGMTLSVGYKLAIKVSKRVFSTAVALFLFVSIGILHWPMVPVVLVVTPAVILFELYRDRKKAP